MPTGPFAWGVSFNSGNPSSMDKAVGFFTWCVRGGQGANLQ
jgi:hypothetical protein